MESTEISKLRVKQILVTNGILLSTILIVWIINSVLMITYKLFFFVLGVIILIQGILSLIKGESTKSFISIFEKIAVYEKQKMGSEWYKEQKAGNVWRLVLSGFMFFQSYLYRNSTDSLFQIELIFILSIVFFCLIIVNVSLIIRFRRIDRSTSELDLKGYTQESNLIGGAFGMIFTLIVLVIAMIYII